MDIKYPYRPDNRTFSFVPSDHEFMLAAKNQADNFSACAWWPTGTVLVKDNKIIGAGANSGDLHFHCGRIEYHCPTGTGYEHCQALRQSLCHSEAACVKDAIANNQETTGADVYLFGHWWCCAPCWAIMIKAGVRNVHLLEDAHLVFTREKRIAILDELKQQTHPGRNHIAWHI